MDGRDHRTLARGDGDYMNAAPAEVTSVQNLHAHISLRGPRKGWGSQDEVIVTERIITRMWARAAVEVDGVFVHKADDTGDGRARFWTISSDHRLKTRHWNWSGIDRTRDRQYLERASSWHGRECVGLEAVHFARIRVDVKAKIANFWSARIQNLRPHQGVLMVDSNSSRDRRSKLDLHGH